MADRDTSPRDGGQAGFQDGELGGGLRKPGFSRGYGRDFGAGGRNQGFDGSWGQGYGGSFDPGGEDLGAGGRTWIDQRADARSGPHAGRGPRGWSRTDARIREAVSEALMEDPLLDAREIEVQVEGGVVSLSGEVPGGSDAHRAEQLARRCGGVGEVRNDLQVHGRPRRDLSLDGRAGEAPNPFHPPGQDHAVTADQRNAALGKGGEAPSH
ncbi:BON domain-containing protein [Phenylobacterium sp.]|uniref:BON domain-containing protein n=1 Tax=Phenylobacterium sp. TaxID=1871053 RepID=UPI002FDF0B86